MHTCVYVLLESNLWYSIISIYLEVASRRFYEEIIFLVCIINISFLVKWNYFSTFPFIDKFTLIIKDWLIKCVIDVTICSFANFKGLADIPSIRTDFHSSSLDNLRKIVSSSTGLKTNAQCSVESIAVRGQCKLWTLDYILLHITMIHCMVACTYLIYMYMYIHTFKCESWMYIVFTWYPLTVKISPLSPIIPPLFPTIVVMMSTKPMYYDQRQLSQTLHPYILWLPI